MWTKKFWKAAAERGIKTGAQFVLLILGVGVGAGAGESGTAQVVNALALDYATLGGAFVGGVLVSALTSVISAGKSGNPSVRNIETVTSK